MYQFKDFNNCDVRITFEKDGFSDDPKHVWVVCRYLGKWLLTKHLKRGWEFPGGKIEDGESVIEAAEREVWEETGGIVQSLHYIGQYEVNCGSHPFYKAIYFAEVSSLLEKEHYFETTGPVLLDELPTMLKGNTPFSFIMRDEVLPYTLKQIAKMQLV